MIAVTELMELLAEEVEPWIYMSQWCFGLPKNSLRLFWVSA
jgi:hypothetical protein